MEVNVFVLLATHTGAIGVGFIWGMNFAKKVIQRRLDKIANEMSQKMR